jgi:sulfite exporter TauE/SafE
MFMLGLLGTAHCVGMCGPLVVAIPGREPGISRHLLYHLGRVGSYTAVGAALGLLGGHLGGFVRVQIGVSLLAALLLAGFGLFRLGAIPEPRWMLGINPGGLPGLGRLLESATRRGRPHAMIAVGLALGFIPCGLSYAAFARALSAGSVTAGALITLVFGLGTLPGLLALGATASRLSRQRRRLFDLLAGMLMLGMAATLAIDALMVL